MQWFRSWRHDGGVEGFELTSFYKTPFSKLLNNHQQKLTLILRRKKSYSTHKDESHNKMVEGTLLWYNQITYLPGGQPTNWKIIILQRISHKNESSDSLIRLPSLGVWHQEEEPPQHFALKASQLECRSTTRLEATETPLLRCTQVFLCTRSQQSSHLIGDGARDTCGSWRVSWGGEG